MDIGCYSGQANLLLILVGFHWFPLNLLSDITDSEINLIYLNKNNFQTSIEGPVITDLLHNMK